MYEAFKDDIIQTRIKDIEYVLNTGLHVLIYNG